MTRSRQSAAFLFGTTLLVLNQLFSVNTLHAGALQTVDLDEYYLLGISLHAITGINHACDLPNVNCRCYSEDVWPTTSVPPNTEITVYVILTPALCPVAYPLSGVQTAFEWDQSWTFIGSTWNCQPNQLYVTTLQPGGSRSGTITTAFDCVEASTALVIGKLYFMTGQTGCLRQITPRDAYGVQLLDCTPEMHLISLPEEDYRIGSVCVGALGQNACWDPGPVEHSTWGGIKASWR